MDIKQVQCFLAPGMARVNALMDQALGSDVQLLDATNRTLRAHGGKMMRPMLALLVAGAAGKPTDDSFRFAAATELLHNATLLHDDVVDGAAQRRGHPTVYSLLGGSSAVLIGDYWLVKCLELVLGAQKETDRVLRIFSNTLGHLTEGELLQLQKATEADTTQADYLRIIYGKTASLFESAALSAAISVAAPEEVVDAMGLFARNLGIAFQIKDDIFDYAQPSEALGKPVGIDLLEGKITQPLLCALETAAPDQALRIRSLVSEIADNPALADDVRSFVHANNGVAQAQGKVDEYVEKAISCLQILPESEEKSYLAQLARFVGQRNM